MPTAPPHRAPGHFGLRPKRGRLRGARCPARRRWLCPGGRCRGSRRGDGQHLRLHRGRQEGLGGHPARRRRPEGGRPGPGSGRRRLPRRALRGTSWPRRCRRPMLCSASTTTPTWPAGCGPSWRVGDIAPTCRMTDGGCCLIAPAARRQRWRRGGAGSRSGERPSDPAPSPGRRADGAGQDRLRLRPALHVLRHPDVPRGLRLPPDRRHRGRGALAGRGGGSRAVPGQREHLQLRQGSRRHPAARTVADRAVRGRRAGLDPGLLPAARGDAAQPGGGDDRNRQGGALLRPVLPARRPGRAPADAPVR